jgi:uncharacterized membrane protein YfcA
VAEAVGRETAAGPSQPTVVSIGVFGGLFSGLLGIGGGTAMVPLMVLFGKLTQRQAHAISLGAMIPIAAVALTVYGAAGKIDYLAAAGLACGAVFGARMGAGFLSRIPEWALKAAFGSFLIVAAVLLLVEG